MTRACSGTRNDDAEEFHRETCGIRNAGDDTLNEIRRCIARSFFSLGDWARWKRREYSDEAVAAVEGRFWHGYIGKIFDDWGYIEGEDHFFEEEHNDMELQWLGHPFIQDRIQFLEIIEPKPEVIRGELVSF